MSKTHELKTWPGPYEAVLNGTKRHEIRVNDRGFTVGDVLVLREWMPRMSGAYPQTVGMDGSARYTDREQRVLVTYMTDGGTWGLPENLCVMSIELVTP